MFVRDEQKKTFIGKKRYVNWIMRMLQFRYEFEYEQKRERKVKICRKKERKK